MKRKRVCRIILKQSVAIPTIDSQSDTVGTSGAYRMQKLKKNSDDFTAVSDIGRRLYVAYQTVFKQRRSFISGNADCIHIDRRHASLGLYLASPEQAHALVVLYQVILGRPPSRSELEFYLARLNPGESVKQIADKLIASKEYRGITAKTSWWQTACKNAGETDTRPNRLQSRGHYCYELAKRRSVRERVPTPRQWLPTHVQNFFVNSALQSLVTDRHGKQASEEVEYLTAIIAYCERNFGQLTSNALEGELLARISKLARRRVEGPNIDVSIIIPVYNNLIYTLASMYSILNAQTHYKFEILVGDDNSTDATPEVIGHIGGCVRLVRHSENKAFLQNCNATALQSRGKYIVFLNNDTIALPQWLDTLLDTFELHNNIGLVGSKLLNSNGTLQEAGSIVWRDGSAQNFGRDCDPRLSEFNYFKDIDYCSGASIAITAALWRQLDGFDQTFAPAYYEDTDLAFRVREAGFRTVYQPRSEIIHHEGRSHGTDTNVGTKAYQVINQQLFFNRWRSVLDRSHFSTGQNVGAARDSSRNKKHVLFIDHKIPQWDRDAGSRYVYQYLHLLVESGLQVTFWPDNLVEDIDYAARLQSMGVEVIYGSNYAGKFKNWLRKRKELFDYVIVSRPDVAGRYANIVRKLSSKPLIYFGHDIHWKRLQRQYSVTGDSDLKSKIKTQKIMEEKACRSCDILIYPSKEECEYIRKIFPEARDVLELPLLLCSEDQLASTKVFVIGRRYEIAKDLLFVGGFDHPPNVDAVKWFVGDILPLLISNGWSGKLRIVGSNIPDQIRALASPRLEIIGRVSDERLRDLYRTSGVAVVPLRFGAGVKGKTIEAFAHGVPMVATSVGLQGIDNTQKIALCGDTADEFAAAVLKLIDDPSAASDQALRAIEFLANNYLRRVAVDRLGRHIPEIATVLKTIPKAHLAVPNNRSSQCGNQTG